jgi:hypothetical protein
MFSNRLSVTKIVVFTDQAVEDFFMRSSADLFKIDRVKLIKGTFDYGFIYSYSERLFPAGKGVGRIRFTRR